MKMEETECFETSTYKIQKTGNYPEEILEFYNYLSVKMEQTECSETSTYKIQTPGNYTEENIQHKEQGESLESRNLIWFFVYYL